MSSPAAAFFSHSKFAVVGASSNESKFGYKVFAWYINHNLQCTPINPGSASIKVDGKDCATKPSLSEIDSPQETAISIVTGPAVTMKALEEAKKLGITAVWMQPDTFNDEVLKFAKDNFKTVVAGSGGAGRAGWCVLVDGEKALKESGKH